MVVMFARTKRVTVHGDGKAALFLLCWLIYAAAYLARAGVSAGYGTLARHYAQTELWLGKVGSAFFIAYALGQLVNGYLGDRVQPARLVLLSLIGSCWVYLLALWLDSAAWLVWLWGFNGVFLSMLWGPMLRLLCLRYGARRKENLALLLGAAPVGGYCLAWLALAPRVPALGWQAVFLAPLMLTGALLVAFWLLVSGGGPQAQPDGWSDKRRSLGQTFRYLRQQRLWPMVLTSLCLGLVKENLALLLPALFVGFMGVKPETGAWFLVLSPMANLLGLVAGRALKRPLMRWPARGLAGTFLAMAAACACLALASGIQAAGFLSLFLLTALAYLASCIQITYIPLAHQSENLISTLVGLFDFSNYMGAAFASALLGSLLARGALQEVALLWLGVCLAAAAFAAFQAGGRRGQSPAHAAPE